MKRHPNRKINRRNYRDTRRYLEYCEVIRQNTAGTISAKRAAIDHLLRWATDVSLTRAAKLRPTFPQYIGQLELSPDYQNKIFSYARRFFVYAQNQWQERYGTLEHHWIESLRTHETPGAVNPREVFGLEQVRAVTSLEPRTLTEERTLAAAAFLFLSGIRVGAFVTLPLRAVHWDQEPVMVRQWPDLGVHTKNKKAANTYLLAHPELDGLHQIAHRWHEKALAAVGAQGMWYSVLSLRREFDPLQIPGANRSSNVRRNLRKLCKRAGVKYLSPHKIRHGHVVWALKHCETIDEFKAVSQNVMHESLITTDSIYSNLIEDDVASRIAGLGG